MANPSDGNTPRSRSAMRGCVSTPRQVGASGPSRVPPLASTGRRSLRVRRGCTPAGPNALALDRTGPGRRGRLAGAGYAAATQTRRSSAAHSRRAGELRELPGLSTAGTNHIRPNHLLAVRLRRPFSADARASGRVQQHVPPGRHAVGRYEHTGEVRLVGEARRQRHLGRPLPMPQAISREIESSQE